MGYIQTSVLLSNSNSVIQCVSALATHTDVLCWTNRGVVWRRTREDHRNYVLDGVEISRREGPFWRLSSPSKKQWESLLHAVYAAKAIIEYTRRSFSSKFFDHWFAVIVVDVVLRSSLRYALSPFKSCFNNNNNNNNNNNTHISMPS